MRAHARFGRFSLILSLIFLFGIFAFARDFSVTINNQPFQGRAFAENQRVYVELVPFLNAVSPTYATFNVSDLTVSGGVPYVSLEGASATLGGKAGVDWAGGSAWYNLKPASSNAAQIQTMANPEEKQNLSIRANHRHFNGRYFVSGYEIYAELVPLARTLHLGTITIYPADLIQTEDGKVYISLQGLASTMNGQFKVNWNAGSVDFSVPETAATTYGPSYGGTGYTDYYDYYPYYPYYYPFFGYYSYGFSPGFFPIFSPFDCFPFGCPTTIIIFVNKLAPPAPPPVAMNPAPPPSSPHHPPTNPEPRPGAGFVAPAPPESPRPAPQVLPTGDRPAQTGYRPIAPVYRSAPAPTYRPAPGPAYHPAPAPIYRGGYHGGPGGAYHGGGGYPGGSGGGGYHGGGSHGGGGGHHR